MDSTEGTNDCWAERIRELRDIAQQCYLLIGLTNDPRLKTYLLDIGLELERHLRSMDAKLAASAGDGGRERDAPSGVRQRADQ